MLNFTSKRSEKGDYIPGSRRDAAIAILRRGVRELSRTTVRGGPQQVPRLVVLLQHSAATGDVAGVPHQAWQENEGTKW